MSNGKLLYVSFVIESGRKMMFGVNIEVNVKK